MALIVLLARPGVWQSIDALYQASTDPTQPVGTSYLYRHALADSIEQAVQKEPGRMLLGYGLGTFRVLGLEVDFLGEQQTMVYLRQQLGAFLYETGYGGLFSLAHYCSGHCFSPSGTIGDCRNRRARLVESSYIDSRILFSHGECCGLQLGTAGIYELDSDFHVYKPAWIARRRKRAAMEIENWNGAGPEDRSTAI